MKLAIFELEGALISEAFAIFVDKSLTNALASVIGIEESVDSAGNNKALTESGVFYEIFKRHMGRLPSSGEWGNIRRTFTQSLMSDISHIAPVLGAEKIFGLAARAGWKSAVFVNSWKDAGEMKIENSGLELEHISFMAFSDNESLEKTKVIQKIIDQAKTSLTDSIERIVYIGSALDDMVVAKTLKLPFIGIGSRFKEPVSFLANYADPSKFIKELDQAQTPAA